MFYARGNHAHYTDAGEIDDIHAVKTALMIMTPECRRAVEIVYFAVARNDPTGESINDGVIRAAYEMNTTTQQVQKWLKKARIIFAVERDLRLPVDYLTKRRIRN